MKLRLLLLTINYAPAFYTMAAQYGVKCTYAKGVSLHYTHTGSAALLYLDWLESGYHVDHLLNGIKHGLITLPIANETISRGSIIRELEQSGIGWGRARYKMWIDAVKRDPELDYGPLTEREIVRIESQQVLIVLFEELFANVAEGDLTSSKVIVAGLVDFIQDYTNGHDQEEKSVAQAITELVTHLSLASNSGMGIQLAIQYVRVELEQITTHATSIPAEGMLHITTLQDGGQSGRAHTYIVGMDDSSWSISTRQDPIVLDDERVRVSEFLPTSTQTASWKHAERISRLGQIRGACTLSFASYDIVDNRELNPAYELLQLFRKKVGQPEADYATLYTYLPSPIGYPSATSGMQLDETDVWLNHLITPQLQIKQGKDLILAAYTNIGEGDKALRGRDNPLFSKFDGNIDTSKHVIDYVSRPDA